MAQREVRPSRRQMIALGGAALASAALAACDSSSGGSVRSSSKGVTRIAQWYHQYGESGTEQAVRRYAAAYKKAKVSVQWTSGDYDERVDAALRTSSGPDVFEYTNGPTIDMITSRQVVDVSGLLGTERSDFASSLLERMTYQGKLYGIPQVVDLQLFLYRKSMLKKAGVPPPKTFEDLLTAAKKLTTRTVKGLFLGNDGGAGVVGGPVLWSSGHDYLTPQDQPDFNNAEVIGALMQLHKLYRSGHLLLDAPQDWSDPRAFINGRTAIQWTGLWVLPQVKKALGDDFGVLPFPGIGGGTPSVPVGAYSSCVSARASDVDAAKAFAKWLWVDQTSDQLDFAQSYGFHVPARRSLIARAGKLRTGEAAKAAGYLDSYGHPQTPMLWTPESSAAFGHAMDAIIRSGADPRSTLSGVEGTVESEIKRFTDS